MFALLKQKRLFGDAFWALFGQLLSGITLLLGTRMLTELVTPDIYGQVALLNGFVALGVAVFSYPFICAGMRLLPECRNQRERASLYSVVSVITARSSVLAIALLILGGGVYAYSMDGDIWLFVLTGILLAVTVRRELGIQLLIGERKQRGASLWQTSDSVLRPVLAIGLVWFVGQKAAWVLAGYILASLISNTLWAIVGRRDDSEHSGLKPYIARTLKRDVWAYAAPLIPMELIFWASGLGDRYVIGYLLTATEVGLYAATYTIVNEAFNRSAMVLLRIFQPVYFQASSEYRIQDARTTLWIWIGCVFALGVIGVSLLWFTKDWVAAWVLAKAYHSATELMPAIALGCALHALGSVVSQPLLAEKRTRILLKGRICGALVAAISIPLMVNAYGLPGAAMANSLYFGVEALVLAMLAKPWRNIGAKQTSKIDSAEDEAARPQAAA
jgi:O-antigen/teichoic acid export membrane protein